MALTDKQKLDIQQTITLSLRNKLQNYTPESDSKPFHYRLLGKDRMALFSFIQSLNTTFGTSIFEPVAKTMALLRHADALTQQTAGDRIASEAHSAIQNIMDGLGTAAIAPNKVQETQLIKDVCQKGEMKHVKPTKVDVKIIGHDGTVYLIDIKTAKPNSGEFKGFKRTLLEWLAASLASNPNAKIETLIVIPYNPYAPKPYERWTIRGMLDLQHELKVADEFWDFLGGKGAYEELLDCFEKVGIALKPEIDEYFSRFKK
jgi:type II restriction enzyme